MIWPKIFETEKLESCWESAPDMTKNGVLDERRAKMLVCANGLEAWGHVMSGLGTLPENFGRVMAMMGGYLDILGTPDSFMEYSDNNKKDRAKVAKTFTEEFDKPDVPKQKKRFADEF